MLWPDCVLDVASETGVVEAPSAAIEQPPHGPISGLVNAPGCSRCRAARSAWTNWPIP